MEDSRSKWHGGGTMQQKESYNGFNSTCVNGIHSSMQQDLSCYSASHASTVRQGQTETQTQVKTNRVKFEKGKSTNNVSKYCAKSWSLNDPELQRKKRVASYKVYAVQGRVKGHFKKNFRWLKDRYSKIVYGWW